MKGQIIEFQIQSNIGIIMGEDGNRYEFMADEWKEQSKPMRGLKVNFNAQGSQAIAVYRVIANRQETQFTEINSASSYSSNDENHGPFDWYVSAFKNYAQFSGRSQRRAYWFFVLFNMIAAFVTAFIDGFIFGEPSVFYGLYALVALIPGIAVSIRRLHDIGKSGWTMLFGLIPLIGPILLLIWFVQPSEAYENQYGPYQP